MTDAGLLRLSPEESSTLDTHMEVKLPSDLDSDKGGLYQEECCHSAISYCVGQTDLKGEVCSSTTLARFDLA